MTLPEIPEDVLVDIWRSPAWLAARDDKELMEAAWPFLYALALRHAADRLDVWYGSEGGGFSGVDIATAKVRRMADEATPGASLRRGLDDVAAGRTVSRGSFAQYEADEAPACADCQAARCRAHQPCIVCGSTEDDGHVHPRSEQPTLRRHRSVRPAP